MYIARQSLAPPKGGGSSSLHEQGDRLWRIRKVVAPGPALAFAILCGVAGSSRAADWPAYRSDNHRSGSVQEVIPVPQQLNWTFRADHPPSPAWPPPARRSYWQRLQHIEPRVADDWAFHPVVADGAVYFGSSADDHVYCLESTTGQLRWAFATDGPVRYAPAVAGSRVYFGSDDGVVYCVEATSGRELWRHRVATGDRRIPGNGRLISAWPVRTGLLVDAGVVYALAGLYPQQGVFACGLDSRTGGVVWKTEVDFSPQGYLLASEKSLFVPTGRSNPVGLDRSNGKVTQRFDGVGGTYTLITDQELVAGRGNRGELAVSDLGSNERLANFEGKHMAVTGRYSYLLSDSNLVALDRLRYREVTRAVKTLSQELAAVEKQRRQTPTIPLADRARELSEQLEQNKARVPACKLWEVATEGGLSLAAAENVIAVGAEGSVTMYSARDGSASWRAPLAGSALGLALADGRLFVTTEQGNMHCFGVTDPGETNPRKPKTPPFTDRGEQLAKAAARILEVSPSRRGFCFVLGGGSGRLAYEIAQRSELRVVILERQKTEVERLRQVLREAGVYGARVTAHAVPELDLPYTDYIANLIVSESAWLDGDDPPWRPAEIQRVLRPYGGVLWLREQDEPFQRGPLEGAGEWTHQFGNPANTSNSGDQLVRADLQLQWFGGPGPRPMVDRHLRASAPLCADGRLFVPAENGLIAIDAYNGTQLWETELPGSQRYSMPYDAGYFSLDGGRVAVAVRESCWILDAATGRKLRTVSLPPGTGTNHHWGYVALHQNRLYGTVQKDSASRTIPGYDQINVDYNNDQPLVTGERLFCVELGEGSDRWEWRGGALINPTLTLHEGRLYFVESRNPEAAGHPTGRVPLAKLTDAFLVALDAEQGSLVWERRLGEGLEASRNILYLAGHGNSLIAAGSFMGDNRDSVYRVACYDTADGQPRWQTEHFKGLPGAFSHGEQVHHPVLLGNRVVTEPMVYDLTTGQRLARATDGADWRLVRPGHSCGTLSGAGECLFFRANNPTVIDLTRDLAGHKEPIKLSPSRAGCWINIIPAAGLVLIPEASSGCVCHYSLQTSMAFLPVK